MKDRKSASVRRR